MHNQCSSKPHLFPSQVYHYDYHYDYDYDYDYYYYYYYYCCVIQRSLC